MQILAVMDTKHISLNSMDCLANNAPGINVNMHEVRDCSKLFIKLTPISPAIVLACCLPGVRKSMCQSPPPTGMVSVEKLPWFV
jgi:hypothetical protein